MDESQTAIENQFKKLPEANQKAISNFQWKEKIKKIATENNLTPEQESVLDTEVLLLLYQLQSADDFFDNLLREVGTSEETTKKLFDSIENEILLPLDNEIIKIEPKNSEQGGESAANEATDEWKRPQLASLPNYSDYEQGKDPYREPIE